MSRWSPTISFGEALAVTANLGVIVGLIFVWVELRQNQTQLSADVELTLANSYQTALGRTIENDHVADIMMMSYLDPQSLTMRQNVQLMGMHAEWMALVYATYELWQNGAVSEDTWLMHSNYYLEFLRTEQLQKMWRGMHHEGMYPEEFMRDLESRMPIPEQPMVPPGAQ